MLRITLGKVYKDKITGFEGVATGYVQYISGCNQALLVPKVGTDNKAGEAQWFDEQRLEDVVGAETIVLDNSAARGCDAPAPKR